MTRQLPISKIVNLPPKEVILLKPASIGVDCAVIHRQNLKDTNDRVAQALCAELDARVDEVIGTAAKPQ